jgi:hypothetical protein|tara:strand:- start:14177 stop:14338 length:162 start_codon:yes stop_codon:yes gene_type:complete
MVFKNGNRYLMQMTPCYSIKNIGEYSSIDKVSLSQGELYTSIANKKDEERRSL